MIKGANFISTGFRPRSNGGFWHLLVAFHKEFRIAYLIPHGKPGYKRLYIGFLEIEWSKSNDICKN